MFDPPAAAIDRMRADPALAPVVARHPAPRFELRRPFPGLVRAIVAQQISTAAARAIHGRLAKQVGIDASAIGAADEDMLRAVGLSRRKVTYLWALAAAERAGDLAGLDVLDDDAVVERLSALPGIGRWTAEMHLIFGLGRLDVWPVDDGGLRQALTALYGAATVAERRAAGERFRPYRSVAAWYLWRSLEG